MSRRINFFATEKDMVSLLKEVEETIPFDVKYILFCVIIEYCMDGLE